MASLKKKFIGLNPWLRGLLILLGVVLIILIILQILVSLFADDYAAHYLKKKIRSSTDSTYTLQFDDLDLNVFAGSVTIKNLHLAADTSSFSDTLSSKPPPGMLLKGTVGQLSVSGVNVVSAMWGRELHIGSVTINNPDLIALKNPHPAPQDTSSHFSSVDSTIYAAISKRYDAAELGTFSIKNGTLKAFQSADTLALTNDLNITLHNMRVDSASARSGRNFITDDISVQAGRGMMNMPDHLNSLSLQNLQISSDNKNITIDSLKLTPRYPRFTFSKKKGVEIDRIDLTIPQLIIHQIDFSRFIDSSRFHAREVDINKARMEDFRDKNLPFPPNNHPPLPNDALLNMRQKIAIDSIKVSDSFISYSEYWYQAPQAGKITFQNLNATLYHVTNYPEMIARGDTMLMNAHAMVMGKSLLKTHFIFPLNTKNGFHKVNGSLDKMKFADFNPILKYVAFVKADDGMINSLTFDMTLDEDHSSGNLIMEYKDLKVSVLDKKSIKQKGVMENIKTFAANIIVKKDNTSKGGMRSGEIQFDRVKRKSVFNYWWKSLLSGIKDSMK